MKSSPSQVTAARLLMQQRTALYAYIFACVRNHADAEDILQNVSVAVMEALDQLRDEAGFLPWAREIARRRVLEHYRHSKRAQAVDPELASRLAEASGRVEESRPASSQQQALLACLEQLPGASRSLIARRYDGSVAGVADLARQVGRSVQGVYAQIKRIKSALRDCVERRLAIDN